MSAPFYPSDEYEYEGVSTHAASNTSPSTLHEVLADQKMSINAKRALLASWASDRRAVENCPALRRLDNGSELHIDDILDALKALDSLNHLTPRRANVLPFPSRRVIDSTQLDPSDGDDDPPPAPNAMGEPKGRAGLDAMALYASASTSNVPIPPRSSY